MKRFLPMICALLVAASADAQGVYNMAEQQARNVANNKTPAGNPLPSASPAPQTQAPDPALQATLRNINNLKVDFGNFDSNPTNTIPLIKDLNEAAHGARPASAEVTQLAQDLAEVLAGNQKLDPQHQRLAQYVHAMFNGSHLTAAQQEMVLSAVQKILQTGGVSAEQVTKITGDLKTIATQTK